MKTKLTPVYLEWEDAVVNNAGWLDEEDAIEWAKQDRWVVRQLGFIIEETKDAIIFANMYEPAYERLSTITRVPKSWVRKRINLTSFIKQKGGNLK